MRKTIVSAVCLMACLTTLAQGVPSDFSKMKIETTLQQFLSTNNAAGMGLFQPSSGSRTQIETFYEGGDDHLAQQGSKDYGFDFSTHRYDRFSDKLFMRGSFHYSLDREKERRWSDVMDPWFSIPFIFGSTVAKDYDSHRCGLEFDLYTAPLSDFVSVGVRTQYDVADISGMRDPRPRTGYLNYRIIPSVLLSFGPHHLGLDLGYGYSKEKLSGLTTIQSYPNLYYYRMYGLDRVTGAIGAYSGFKHQFYGSRFLGDISYNYTSGPLRALVSAGMEYGRLDAFADRKQSPGSYDYFLYRAVADLQYRSGNKLHVLHLKGSIKDAGATEKLQELQSEKDPVTGVSTETWVTLYEYRNRYMLGQKEASLDYTLFGACKGKDYGWSVNAGAGYSAFDKECFLPHSEFSSERLNIFLGGSFRLVEKKSHRLEAGLRAEGIMPLGGLQDLYFENEYAKEVLEVDAAYYSRQRIGGSGSLTWTFPMNLGKAGKANGYLRLSGGYCKALPQGGLANAAVTVGLFTF